MRPNIEQLGAPRLSPLCPSPNHKRSEQGKSVCKHITCRSLKMIRFSFCCGRIISVLAEVGDDGTMPFTFLFYHFSVTSGSHFTTSTCCSKARFTVTPNPSKLPTTSFLPILAPRNAAVMYPSSCRTVFPHSQPAAGTRPHDRNPAFR